MFFPIAKCIFSLDMEIPRHLAELYGVQEEIEGEMDLDNTRVRNRLLPDNIMVTGPLPGSDTDNFLKLGRNLALVGSSELGPWKEAEEHLLEEGIGTLRLSDPRLYSQILEKDLAQLSADQRGDTVVYTLDFRVSEVSRKLDLVPEAAIQNLGSIGTANCRTVLEFLPDRFVVRTQMLIYGIPEVRADYRFTPKGI